MNKVILLNEQKSSRIPFSPERALIAFFERVAQKDQPQLWKLKQERSFTISQKHWCFTLPDLYVFLQHQEDLFTSIGYKKFRQIVFNCPINRNTKLHGAEIIIDDNQGNVDQSRYALIWLNNEQNV